MAILDNVQMAMEGHIENAETVKLLVLQKLTNEGIITDDDAVKFSKEFGFVLVKPKWYKRIFNTDDDVWVYKCVKLDDKDE